MAQSNSTSPNEAERASAMQLGRASYKVSIAGIVVGAVFFIVLLVVQLPSATENHY